MSWVKLNVFHWHISDAQSFPLSVPGFTELSEKGAYSSEKVYTPDDVAGLVTYAGEVSPAAASKDWVPIYEACREESTSCSKSIRRGIPLSSLLLIRTL